jgi:hypothetical protein
VSIGKQMELFDVESEARSYHGLVELKDIIGPLFARADACRTDEEAIRFLNRNLAGQRRKWIENRRRQPECARKKPDMS